jgi:PPIC-type PPIASE domain
MTARQVSKEPLLHFFVLGAGLFVLFAWLNRGAMVVPDEVVVDEAQINSLAAQFERVWQRPPTTDEIRDLVDGWIREEVLYREGVALGLDVNDSVVRRRIAQKMAFIADGAATMEPTDAELEEWLEAHPDKYRIEPVYSLQQVYFDPEKNDSGLPERLKKLGSTLDDEAVPPDGDATLLPARLESARASEMIRTFGADFAAALGELDIGDWRGPVSSAYGLHLIRVDAIVPARQPTLDEVRAAVERDWSAAQSEQMNDAFYQAVRARYTVRTAASAAYMTGSVSSNAR